MKPLNIADNATITVSPERLRSDLGIGSAVVGYAAVEQAIRRGRAAQAAAVLRSMVAARTRREAALEAAIHRARSRDASILRRVVRRLLTAGEAPSVGPTRRADGDGFGVVLGGTDVTFAEPDNNDDRRLAA